MRKDNRWLWLWDRLWEFLIFFFFFAIVGEKRRVNTGLMGIWTPLLPATNE